ncbi:hypothetical protein IJ425_02030 [bacterium]|nr:hypothetical protein [bacterium]
MKKSIFLFLSFIFINSCFALDLRYDNAFQKAIMRPSYNPYSSTYKYPYQNPYQYRNYNKNNAKRIQRLNKIKRLNRIKNNFLTLTKNNYNSGTLTGYSIPITSDAYSQTYIQNPYFNQKYYTPKYNTNLYTLPSGNNTFYDDGRYIIRNNTTQSSTGVKIIYD